MANEEHAHVALPKLYGAPAYARPPVLKVVTADRPFDPDSLPIEAHQTEEDRELAQELDESTWTAGLGRPDRVARGLAAAARPAVPPQRDHAPDTARRRDERALTGDSAPGPTVIGPTPTPWGSSSIG